MKIFRNDFPLAPGQSLPTEAPNEIFGYLLQISSLLDPSVDLEKLSRKIRFLHYDLVTHMLQGPESALERAQALRDFIFINKQFRCRIDLTVAHDTGLLLHQVLCDKTGIPSLVALIVQALGRSANLDIGYVKQNSLHLAKVVENGKSYYFDLLREGQLLSKTDLLELFNLIWPQDTCPSDAALEALSFEATVYQHLSDLRQHFLLQKKTDQLLTVLGVILNLQPNNFKVLAQRAQLRADLGFHREALVDLKRYFSFYDEKQCSSQLVELYYRLKADKDHNESTSP